jgi:hypothetical protein
VNDERARQRAAERAAREDEQLAAAIERCWLTRFGKVAVTSEPTLMQIRRGGR